MFIVETKGFQQVQPLPSLKTRKGLEISERRDPGASAKLGIPPAPGGTGKAHLLSGCAHRDLCQGSEGRHRPAFPEWERWELYSGTVHQNKSLWGIPEAAPAPGTAHTEVLLPPREEKLGLKRSQCLQQPRAGQGPRSDTPRSLQGSRGFTSPAPSVPPQHHPTAGATATSAASLGQQPGMGTEVATVRVTSALPIPLHRELQALPRVT